MLEKWKQGTLLIVLLIVSLVLVYTNKNENKYADLITQRPALEAYIEAFTTYPAISTDQEIEHVYANENRIKDWINGDLSYMNLRLPDEIFATYVSHELVTFESALITCGQLRFEVGAKRLINFISARQASVALMQGDKYLADEDFKVLFALVCHKY